MPSKQSFLKPFALQMVILALPGVPTVSDTTTVWKVELAQYKEEVYKLYQQFELGECNMTVRHPKGNC